MIDIYNEEGFIKNLIGGGISSKWQRDLKLLIRYWHLYEGLTKAEITKKAKEKIKIAQENVPDFHYNEFEDFKTLNKVITSAYNDTSEIRTIRSVEITKEVLDWFLNLEKTFEISEEQAEKIRKKRKKVHFKGTHPINWDRTKYLFTFYIWTKIQENYLDRPNVHYIEHYVTRFKEDAFLPTTFKMEHEGNLLYDLGLIDINFHQGITPKFMDEVDVFKIPLTEENKIVVLTGEFANVPRDFLKSFKYDKQYMTLYNPGYWLTVQKYGTFKCQECGEEFIHYGSSKNEQRRKYCKECYKLVNSHDKKDRPVHRWCKCCGYEFIVESETSKSIFCPECQDEINNAIRAGDYERADGIRNGTIKLDRIELINKKKGIRTCVDCGKTFTVSPTNHNTVRCPECQEIHKRELETLRQRKHRELQKEE